MARRNTTTTTTTTPADLAAPAHPALASAPRTRGDWHGTFVRYGACQSRTGHYVVGYDTAFATDAVFATLADGTTYTEREAVEAWRALGYAGRFVVVDHGAGAYATRDADRPTGEGNDGGNIASADVWAYAYAARQHWQGLRPANLGVTVQGDGRGMVEVERTPYVPASKREPVEVVEARALLAATDKAPRKGSKARAAYDAAAALVEAYDAGTPAAPVEVEAPADDASEVEA